MYGWSECGNSALCMHNAEIPHSDPSFFEGVETRTKLCFGLELQESWKLLHITSVSVNFWLQASTVEQSYWTCKMTSYVCFYCSQSMDITVPLGVLYRCLCSTLRRSSELSFALYAIFDECLFLSFVELVTRMIKDNLEQCQVLLVTNVDPYKLLYFMDECLKLAFK